MFFRKTVPKPFKRVLLKTLFFDTTKSSQVTIFKIQLWNLTGFLPTYLRTNLQTGLLIFVLKTEKNDFLCKKTAFFQQIQRKYTNFFASFRTDIKNPVCKFLRIGVYDNPVKFYSCFTKLVTWEDRGVFRIFRFENNVWSCCGHKCQLRDLGLGMCSSFRALT